MKDALLRGCLPLAQAHLLHRNISHDTKTNEVEHAHTVVTAMKMTDVKTTSFPLCGRFHQQWRRLPHSQMS